MIGEILPPTNAKIFEEIFLPDGDRIVAVCPISGKWKSQDAANRNIYRVNRFGKLVWRVQRDDRGHKNWSLLNEQAKRDDPMSDGFRDPFIGMTDKLFPADENLVGNCSSSTSRSDALKARSMNSRIGLTSHKWLYSLDPETGYAYCTGIQVK